MEEICSNCKLSKDKRWFHVVRGERVCGNCYQDLIEAFEKLISTPSPHWMGAKVWVGKEKEGEVEEVRIFTDAASIEDISTALHLHPEAKAIYFGHSINWDTVKEYYKRIHCIVEVDNPEEVDADLMGKISVVLRVPNWITFVKTINYNLVFVAPVQMFEPVPNMNTWSGQKVYEKDEVIK